MAGENDDVNDTDQAFRYPSLVFADQTNQANYEHYQRQVTNNKTTHTRYINTSKTELSNNLKKTPRNDALPKMIMIEKEYIVKESQAKLDKAIENNREFTTFICGHDFDDHQIQSFEAHVDVLNREALNKHLAFVEDVDKMTENFQPSPVPATSSEGENPNPRSVNRPDLAEGCSSLSEDNN